MSAARAGVRPGVFTALVTMSSMGATITRMSSIMQSGGRALERCRRAQERGRRVRGRVVAAGDAGLLVDLGGVYGHAPAEGAGTDARGLRRSGVAGPARRGERWTGWVIAVTPDLVHLTSSSSGTSPSRGPVRSGIVEAVGSEGARVRLDGAPDPSAAGKGRPPERAIVPFGELSWFDDLSAGAPLAPGDTVRGRISELTLDGPVVSPRSLTPTPWPAVALALAPGTRVPAQVEAVREGRALVRLEAPARPTVAVGAERLPDGAEQGSEIEVVVGRVDPVARRLTLDELGLSLRSSRPAQAAGTGERRAPPRAAEGSRS